MALCEIPISEEKRWYIEITYEGLDDMQLIVGFLEEKGNSDEINYDTFLGSEKNTWGYKTSGELLHNNAISGSVVHTSQKQIQFVYDGLKHQFFMTVGEDNQILLFDELPKRIQFAVSLLNPDSSVLFGPVNDCRFK